jgi:hypothetical protein
VNSPTIGIKTADHTFYPIMEDDTRVRRRLVLTTVRDNQTQVQIDLFRSVTGTLEDSEYVGSLIVQDIEETAKGEPEVILDLGIDTDGNLSATARDERSGSYQSLSVNLTALQEQDLFEVPDFEIGSEFTDEGFGEQESPSEEFTGEDLEDEAFDDVTFDDETFDGETFDGETFDDEIFDDETAEFSADLSDEAFDQGDDFDQDDAWQQQTSRLQDSFGREDTGAERVLQGYEKTYEDLVPPPRAHPVLYLGFLFLALAMLGILIFFVFRFIETDPIPPLRAYIPALWMTLPSRRTRQMQNRIRTINTRKKRTHRMHDSTGKR